MRISGSGGYAVPMNHDHLASFDLARALHAHRVELPQRAAHVALFTAFLASSPDVFQRWHPPGHFTGSVWLVSADGERVLLTHHRKQIGRASWRERVCQYV